MTTKQWIRAGAAVVAAFLLSMGLASLALSQGDKPTIKLVPIQQTARDSGAEMYRQYCAACHGMEGRGNGPAAGALVMAPVDLTQLSRKNAGKFPQLRIQQVLIMETDFPAHGNRDMPMWGTVLRSVESGNTGLLRLRIYNLTKHIESLQK